MLTEKVSMVTLDDKPPDWGTLDDWGESLCKQFYLAFEGVKMPADAENAEDRKIYKDTTNQTTAPTRPNRNTKTQKRNTLKRKR
jgi:hypothetical protein